MATKICIYSPKGGVGKTSCTLALSGELSKRGHKVLLIDADPLQGATKGLQHDKSAEIEYAKLFMDYSYDQTVQDPRVSIVPTNFSNLYLMPASPRLDKAIKQLTPGTEDTMKILFADLEDDYDFIFIDLKADRNSPLVLNGLVFASHVLIPITSDQMSIEAYRQARETLETIRMGVGAYGNRHLTYLGALFNMYSNKRKDDNDVLGYLKNDNEETGFAFINPPIREVKATVQNSAKEGIPICYYAADSNIANEYIEVANEIISRIGRK
jgi:cellulose biosynthesis protein BcsQ